MRRGRRKGADAVIVGYPGHLDLGRARRLGHPVVFNPLVSLWDTFVNDRGRFRPGSLRARALRAIDRRAFRAADLVVVGHRCPRGALPLARRPARRGRASSARRSASSGPGGAPTGHSRGALRRQADPAARPRDDPRRGPARARASASCVVGSGQLDRLLDDRPPNVEHVPWVDYEQLPGELHRASCALGIFGTSEKAQRVIPNKVFQALACGTPVVTADTPAARELLRNGESALLVPPGDPAGAASTRSAAVDARRSPKAGSRPTASTRAKPCSARAGAA